MGTDKYVKFNTISSFRMLSPTCVILWSVTLRYLLVGICSMSRKKRLVLYCCMKTDRWRREMLGLRIWLADSFSLSR